MELMRCGVWVGDDHFEVQERPAPIPGPGQVRVRVAACGVCLTEVHSIQGAFGPSTPPRVMGHEIGGVVEQLGPTSAASPPARQSRVPPMAASPNTSSCPRNASFRFRGVLNRGSSLCRAGAVLRHRRAECQSTHGC